MAQKKGESKGPASSPAPSGKAAREGHVLLAAPSEITGVSLGGISYPVVDGVIEVPHDHVPRLGARGFTPVSTE